MTTEKICPACQTADCPKQAMLEEKSQNPPKGMGGGLWIHGEEFRAAMGVCRERMIRGEGT